MVGQATCTVVLPPVRPGAEALRVVTPGVVPAVTVTVALWALAGIVTCGGTLATALLLLSRVTTWPVDPAGLVSATVTLPVVLGVSVSGFGVNVMVAGGACFVTVRVKGCVAGAPIPLLAVMVRG
jgi:hypothetical protein